MTETFVEKLARKRYERQAKGRVHALQWELIAPQARKERCDDMAETLRAARVPSEGMLWAARTYDDDPTSTDTWQAMIDQALQEHEEASWPSNSCSA